MRLAILAGLYVAVVLSAQIGAQKFIRLPFTHLVAPGGVYSIGVALALVQLAHYSGVTRRDGAVNAQLVIGLGFVGSAFFAGYIAILVHSHPGVPGQEFDRVVGSTWRTWTEPRRSAATLTVTSAGTARSAIRPS